MPASTLTLQSQIHYTRALQVSETQSQPPSPPSPSSPKYSDHVLNKPDHQLFHDKPDTHSRREPAFKRHKVSSELKQIFETKVKPLLRRESAEQFDLEIHSPKGRRHFVARLFYIELN